MSDAVIIIPATFAFPGPYPGTQFRLGCPGNLHKLFNSELM